MQSFRNFIESVVNDKDIKFWSGYAQSRIFATPKEAQDWIFHIREKDDREFGNVFGVEGPQKNREFAEAMPLYQSGKSYKIGKRIRIDNRFRLSQLQVKMPSLEELNTIAQSNGDTYYRFVPVQHIRINTLLPEDDGIYGYGKELEKIKNLAYKIKNDGWIEPVVYDFYDRWLIEGQHRARAVRLLGFKTIPAIGVKYDKK